MRQPAPSGHHGHDHHREHGREHGHEHPHRSGSGPEHGHDHASGALSRVRHLVRPHSHDAADKVDAGLEASREGMRALWVSAAMLGATALIQAAVVAVSGSVALLGDTLHNGIDALSVVPLAIAFVAGRRPPTRRYTYGYGRAEDLAGVVIVMLIAASAVATTWVAASRLTHPHRVSDLAAV